MNHRNGIRLFAILFCLLLTLAVFASCNTEETPNGDESTSGVGNDGTTAGGETSGNAPADEPSFLISDYTLIYPDGDTDAQEAAEALESAAKDAFGTGFKAVRSDFVANVAEIDPNAPEILVGATNRTESESALADLGGKHGYVLKMVGKKLVVNGTYSTVLDEAVLRFIADYLQTGKNGALSIPSDLSVVENSANSVSLLTEAGKTDFYIVIGERVDTTEDSTSTGADTNRTDYVVPFFINLKSAIDSALGIDLTVSTDAVPTGAYEILLGRTNRPETNAFLEGLAPNEYGYGVFGTKIVVAGWSDLTIAKAADLFRADFAAFLNEDGGFKNLVLNESDGKTATYDTWNMDLPLYPSGNLAGAVQALNDSYELYYENTTKAEYDAYCTDLEAKGYRLHQNNQIGNNYYATYYDAKTMIHVYYVDYLGAVRFITESRSTAILPQLTDPYEKITETTFTLMDLDTASGNFGNAFIITLEDGSFIVHDGGGTTGGKDCDEMYRLLQNLNQRKDGKIVIAAWILSHEHGDHFGNFNAMISKYYKKGVILEKVLYNVSVDSFDYNTGNPSSNVQNGTLAKIQMNTQCQLIRMHTGQKIQIRNLTIEVFYTWEDIYPLAPHHFNNTSFITRFDIGEGENRQRVSILGDVEDVGSNIMVDMYGDALKTDILQVAHHGWGGTVALYALFKPDVVLWPTDQGTVNSHLKESATSYYPVINKSLINQQNVILLVVADLGHKTIPLPLIGLTEDETLNYEKFVTTRPRES